jgi:hypothetical protein
MTAKRITAAPRDAKAQVPLECREKSEKWGQKGPRSVAVNLDCSFQNVTTSAPRKQQSANAISAQT